MYLSSRVEDFIYDYSKVTNDQFDNFMAALSRGEGEDFLKITWNKEIGRYLPVKKLTPRPWKESWDKFAETAKDYAIRKPARWIEENTVFMKPTYYRLWTAFHDHLLNAVQQQRWYANLIDRYRRKGPLSIL
ncbi:MAG: hypothetical protein R2877_00950 [Bdellovibrionota bacterium]